MFDLLKTSWRASAAIRIGLAYLVLASLWIWGSDWLALQLLGESAALARVQSWKGELFVLFTAALLFWLVRREERAQAAIQNELQRARNRLEHFVDTSPAVIYALAFDSEIAGGWRVFYVSGNIARLTGYPAADWLAGACLWFDHVHPDDRQRVQQAQSQLLDAGLLKHRYRFRRRDGQYRWIDDELRLYRGPDGEPIEIVGNWRDVTEQEQAEARISHLSRHDALTGLPNRVQLRDRMQTEILEVRREQEAMALLVIDLDRFKYINDSLGHRAGDALLVEMAARLRQAVGPQDTVSRLGGDEFTLLLPRADAEAAAHLAQQLIERISAPCQIDSMGLIVTPSIGIAMFPDDGCDVDALLQAGDTAMYRAKAAGGANFQFYEPGMHLIASRTLQLENALRWALERQELELHYQPQIELCSGRVTGSEALLRWRHPELGLVPPTEFMPIAEASGLILPIGEWVLRTAVAQNKAWQQAGLAPVVVAVNVSAVQFRQAQFPELVSAVLAEAGLEPGWLELELTESVVSADPEEAIDIMERLDRLGVLLSVDDFGTGYSSLSYLKRFPLDRLKIDQSFVRDLGSDTGRLIVSGVIAMARSLGLRTIAEGVETPEQAAALSREGCDEVQGYWYARPMPAGQHERWFRDYRPARR